ncbi:MAG: RNA polymerase sigma-I factor [Actinobacteria bacterium]|nr:RNA polymerase sigma-I factor [Actinomycetota bacterium]
MALKRKSLEERVAGARNGSEDINRLISEFKPFIASVAQKRAGRYLQYGSDDELSISLMAFKEAVDSFDGSRGRFLSFAKMVISMRLIDYYRREARGRGAGAEAVDEEAAGELWDRKSMEQFRMETQDEDRKLEVIEYMRILAKWGIRMKDLIKASPQNAELRNVYQKVAGVIAGDKVLLGEMIKSRKLPLKKIMKYIPVHRKKLERGRIYIIAMVLAIGAGFSYINLGRSDS